MHIEDKLVLLTQKTFVCNDEGKFLTLFRTETAPTRPCTWDLPGGMYERGEDPEQGARREITEETGLTVGPLTFLAIRGASDGVRNSWVRIAYRADALTTDVTLSFEHNDYRWVTPEEFLTLESSESWKEIVREFLLAPY